MARHTATQVNVLDPIDPEQLPNTKARVAVMTGTGRVQLTEAQAAAMKAFVQGGGTILIDAAGGDNDFYQAVSQTFSGGAIAPGAMMLRSIDASAPLFNLPERKIEAFAYRGAARNVEGKGPRLRALYVDQRPALILSREDITAALVGYPSRSISGYATGGSDSPGTAFEILRNIVLSTASSGTK